MERIMGAFMFRRGVYDEVEKDPSFNSTAWIIVAVVHFLSSIGRYATTMQTDSGVVGWLISAVLGTVFGLIAFALGCAIAVWVGRTLFKATITFDEMVRTLGLASVWNIVGLIGILGAFVPALICLTGSISYIAAIAYFVASLFALKAALDLDWVKTIITAIAIAIVQFVLTALLGVILLALGFATGAL